MYKVIVKLIPGYVNCDLSLRVNIFYHLFDPSIPGFSDYSLYAIIRSNDSSYRVMWS